MVATGSANSASAMLSIIASVNITASSGATSGLWATRLMLRAQAVAATTYMTVEKCLLAEASRPA